MNRKIFDGFHSERRFPTSYSVRKIPFRPSVGLRFLSRRFLETRHFRSGTNALKQHRGWLVIAPFAAGEFVLGGDEFAAKRLREDGLRQQLDTPRCLCQPCFRGVRTGQQCFYPADDLMLLRERWKWERFYPHCADIEMRLCDPVSRMPIRLCPSDKSGTDKSGTVCFLPYCQHKPRSTLG
jgi:hypothetical protein